ncbi:PREDICTED: uncharacterized protein LOC104593785 [Nelumbo nucifera]|uniref:Uncharacterized protein LOC104593785 n=1 Tax=Nelumbo nucifera TaxID=4432 RepID=A0A1U7ZEI3_NELNU|nr:PREDICTED: uncharacterized protein LOC104593785 [Nelumbo nucifera]
MGDLQAWLPLPDGILTEDRQFPAPSSSSSPNPNPFSIGAGSWSRAELTTHEIVCRIQPTVVSEERRKAVIDYVQRLIRGYLGSEVFPFGSVPLKTYLPDGDIDLTALSYQNVEDALANDVRTVLEGEEQNNAAEFEVKDVQYIHAEVKLVKCLVQNIVVDISFNQLGGLCTLCFLERIDQLIGKDHLFKRSIILIKAWCYYESRILGAHHGLISTYALETLVLYIFHLYHSSLDGPLAVLYRFLDYFSKFDWDNYCISLNGPVFLSSLPEIVAEVPENGRTDLLLSKEFLKNCMDVFSVPARGNETNSRAFPKKHLNIIDPLKENNNLGRSVSKGNFYRIRSAFTYGARKLGRILLLPGESLEVELKKFFMNTLDRHGNGQRPDVQDPVPHFCDNGSGLTSSKSGIGKIREDKSHSESPSIDSGGTMGESSLCEQINGVRISGTERESGTEIANEPQSYSNKVVPAPLEFEPGDSAHGHAVSGHRLDGDAKDLATSRVEDSRNINETTSSSAPPRNGKGTSLFGKAQNAPRLHFSQLFPRNGKPGSGNTNFPKPVDSGMHEKVSSWFPPVGASSFYSQDMEETSTVASSTIYSSSSHEGPTFGSINIIMPNQVVYSSEDLSPAYGERDLTGNAGSLEAMDTLADLSGDYDSHLYSLQYAQQCHEYHEYTFWGTVLPISPSSPQLQNKHGWDTLRRSMQFKRNIYSHVNTNGVIPGSQFYTVNSPLLSPGAFIEETSKPRGTGTYFPNTNHHSYRERPSLARGKNAMVVTQGQLQRSSRNNGRAMTPPKMNVLDKGSHELSQADFPVLSGHGKPGSLELFQSGHPTVKSSSHSNGFSAQTDRLEFGSFGHMSLGAHSAQTSKQSDSGTTHNQGAISNFPTSAAQRMRPVLGMQQEKRVAVQTYHLKDEDFPPLSI